MKTVYRIATLFLFLGFGLCAQAQSNSSPALQTCEQQNNVKGHWDQLTVAQKKTLHQCMQAAHQAAKQACTNQIGAVSGQSRTPAQIQDFHSCMEQKGFFQRPKKA